MKTHRNNPAGKFGWLPDLPDHRDHLYAAPRAALLSLPARVNLAGKCPSVYNQGNLGSCTANAIAGAIEFDRLKQRARDFTPSRLFIYYNEREMEHTVPVDSGARIRDGIKSVANRGDCPETEWPYDIAKFAMKPPRQCYDDALKYKVVSYQKVAQNLNQMKGCLAAGYPFVFGITVFQNFPPVGAPGDIPMPGQPFDPPEGHAMLAVGYEETRRVFLVRNSWGRAWGRHGYGTIPYEYLLNPDLADDYWTIRVVLA